jgi:hypothetical protein
MVLHNRNMILHNRNMLLHTSQRDKEHELMDYLIFQLNSSEFNIQTTSVYNCFQLFALKQGIAYNQRNSSTHRNLGTIFDGGAWFPYSRNGRKD